MIANDRARQIIMDAERLEMKAYLCPAGVPTIGWGHTGDVTHDDVKNHRTITRHEAEAIFELDVHIHEEIVRKAVKVPLNENQFSALVSFVFNVGHGRKEKTNGPNDKGKDGFVILKSGNQSSMLHYINGGAPLTAANEFPKWNKGGGVVLKGLVKRRLEEQALFLTPVNRA